MWNTNVCQKKIEVLEEILKTLSIFDLSISYQKVIQIQNQIANIVCDMIDENNGQFIPLFISKEKRVSFAINNADFNDDAVNGKNEFYGMRIAICQQGTNVNILTWQK